MTKKSTDILIPTVEDAFELGRREGLKEAFTEIKNMIKNEEVYSKLIHVYIEARLKSIQDFSFNNPFKQKE